MEPKYVVQEYIGKVLSGRSPLDEIVSDVELGQRVRRLKNAFPDLEVETTVLLGEGNLVAGHFAARGTHRGLYQGVPPTGRTWRAGCTAVFRIENGRIADAWVTWDQLSLLEQLGAVERVQAVSA